jgi:hypothetical protein
MGGVPGTSFLGLGYFIPNMIICWWHAGGRKNAFAWRALMLVAAGAGGAFLLDGLVAVACSIFLWIGFISKLLCNLLLMPSTKLCNI